LRIIHTSDETANYIVIWVLRLGAVVAYGYFLGDTLRALGVQPAVLDFFYGLFGLLVTGLVVILILQNRQAVAAFLSTPSPSGRQPVLGTRIAEIWHVLAIVYVVAVYLFWLLGVDGGVPFLLRASLLSLLTLVVAGMIGAALRRLMMRGFSLAADLRAAFPGLEERANRFLPLLHGLLRIVLGFLTILVILEIWGLDSFDWLASDAGRHMVGRVIAILVVIAGAFVLSELVSALIERYLARNNDSLSATGRHARTRTLLPLLRNAFRILLTVVVILVVLSEIGVDIAPLLAGAGIIGLAIGFGAQTLVKDVITGFFILAEDTISVGDVIDVGGHSGVVESVTIRTMRLRDGAGAVHTIPFSAVTSIVNMTKDFAYAVFDVNVAYDEDIDRIVGLLREIGAGLADDAAFKWRTLAPIEVSGVERFSDSAIVVRARIKTLPQQQWDVAREFNRRLIARFDREGIRIPYPQRILVREAGNTPPAPQPAPQPASGG
jgi:small conductance mechanosensitive channel